VKLIKFYFTNQLGIVLLLRVKRIFGLIADQLLPVYDHLTASRENSINSNSGNYPYSNSKRVAIIASHITSVAAVSNFIFPIKELIANGYFVCLIDTGKIEFSTLNPKLLILKRNNLGRDFASFRDALKNMNLTNTEDLILMNDSCYWERNSMNKYFKKTETEFSDVRCITLSFQKTPHPQSYFLHFKKPVIRLVLYFFQNEVRNWKSKRNIVNRGEIQLARYLNKSNVKIVDVFGGNNFMYNFENPIPGRFFATNTMAFHAQEVYELIGVIKVKQKNFVGNSENQRDISEEFKDLFYVV